jgi:hypothetical protein
VSPTEVTGRTDPLPTAMDEGTLGLGGRKRDVTGIGCGVVRRTRVSDPLCKRGCHQERHHVEGVG